MPLDGITSKFHSLELSKELVGSRIDRIFQPDSYDIFLKLRNDNKNYHLLLSANPSNPRIHLSEQEIENPMIPLRFCTVLRKYLLGGRILSIKTPGYERIFMIEIQTVNEMGDKDNKTLIIEIMGRFSNIIFLNQSGKIIDCALHIDEKKSRVREVLPARIYEFPPSQNKKSPIDIIQLAKDNSLWDFKCLDSQNITVSKYLLNLILGASPIFINELCFISDINSNDNISELDTNKLNILMQNIIQYMEDIINLKYSPTLFYRESNVFLPSDFHCFDLSQYSNKKNCSSISSAMDEYYSRIAKQSNLSQKKSYLVKLLSQRLGVVQKKIVIHNKDIEECIDRDKYKKYGDLILSYIYLIKPSDEEINVIDFYDENSSMITIPLQSNLTPSQNAQKYYKKYNKLKSKFEISTRLLEEEIFESNYYKSVQNSLENVDSSTDIDAIKEELFAWDNNLSKSQHNISNENKKTKNKKPAKKKKDAPIPARHYISSDGFEILVGRNNIQNDFLTTKLSSKDDIWFHIQKAPGTHVIVKSNRQEVPLKTIEEAAMLSAWFSKSNESSINTKVIIDYCEIKNVWKPKKSAPGHVLYKEFNSITVKTLMPENISVK